MDGRKTTKAEKQTKVIMADGPQHIQARLVSIFRMNECLLLIQSFQMSHQVDMMVVFMHTLDDDDDFLLGPLPPTLIAHRHSHDLNFNGAFTQGAARRRFTSSSVSPVLERCIRLVFWSGGSETRAGGGAAVLAGALTVSAGGSFTPSMAMSTLESSCRGMLPSSEEKGLGGFSRHISQLVLPVRTGAKKNV